MAEENTEENLYQLWMLYAAKNDVYYFDAYVSSFIQLFSQFIDKDFTHLNNEGFTELGPHLTKLPEGFLQSLSKILISRGSSVSSGVDGDSLQNLEHLVQCLIVICRNQDNADLVASYSFVSHLVAICGAILTHLCGDDQTSADQCGDDESNVDQTPVTSDHLVTFFQYVIHFMECLYDPYFVWRKQLKGWSVDTSRLKHRAADLHVEVVPFIYECFQQKALPVCIQVGLLHLFGAVITGSQSNAMKAICPATLDVLLALLSSLHRSGPINDEYHDDVIQLKDVVLKCLVRMVHVIHCCSPEQRQVEVGHLLEGFFAVLKDVSNEEQCGSTLQLQLKMINSLNHMFTCKDRASLQVIFVSSGVFESIIHFLQQTMALLSRQRDVADSQHAADDDLGGSEAQSLAMAVVRVINSIQLGSPISKNRFKEKIGYCQFVEALKSLGQPSKQLLQTLLDLVIEDVYDKDKTYTVKNTQAALMLIQWLPDIQSHDLQIWLTEWLRTVCTSTNHNRMHCCREGMITAIVNVLPREKQISPAAIGHLIKLLSSLGLMSITATELKRLVSVLRLDDNMQQMPYVNHLMHAMSVMAQQDGKVKARNYFNLERTTDGISLAGVRKWPGNGFSFHAWVSLDNETREPQDTEFVRRHLYSFYSSSTCGFEAFFTEEGVLVVGTSVKKEFYTVTVAQNPVRDNHWHSVDIVHTSSRTPFKPSQVSVYMDGHLWLTSQLKFPSLTEPFSCCRIGCSGLVLSPDKPTDGAQGQFTSESSHKKSPFKIPFTIPKLHVPGESPNSASSIASGMQDTIWGASSSLQGRLASVCIFHDVLQPAHVRCLYGLGPNSVAVFKSQETEMAELGGKLVLHYNAKACQEQLCMDLSLNQNHGRLVGQQCVTHDVKDSINCIGGIQILFPLLEHAKQIDSPASDVLSTTRGTGASKTEEDDWVFISNNSLADTEVVKNQVANFITLLQVMVERNRVNQDVTMRTHALATVGALLQQVDASLIDVSVLFAIQYLVEAILPVNISLLHSVYQYLLFDFRIWSKTEFHVRIGHIQYLSTKLKDDKKYFRKKYGVQYLMDVIRQYYSAENDDSLSSDDCKAIRGAILGLVKYYVVKEIKADELKHILKFVMTVRNQEVVCEVLDLLIFLLESRGSSDQIFLLMFEPEAAEILYPLILPQETRFTVKEKVLKMLLMLLKTEKVYEKNKTRLHLQDIGFAGLTSLMHKNPVSMAMVTSLLDQALLSDSTFGLNSALSVIQLLSSADVDIKVEASRKLLSVLFTKQTAAKTVSKLISWQEILSKLLIVKANTVNRTPSEMMLSQSNPRIGVDSTSDLIGGTDTTNQNDANRDVQTCNGDDSHRSNNKNQNACGDTNVLFTLDNADFLSESQNSESPAASSALSDNDKSAAMFSSTPRSRVSTQSSLFDQGESFEFSLSFDSTRERSRSRSSTTSMEDLSAITSPSSVLKHLGNSSTPGGSDTIPEDVDVSSSNETDEINSTLRSLGLSMQISRDYEQVEELAHNVLVILFTVLWRGVDGSDKEAWKERMQVFSAISRLASGNELVKTEDELHRRLLEMMVEASIMDAKEPSQLSATYYENAFQLVKVIHHFVSDSLDAGTVDRYSEQLLETVLSLMDLLSVWDKETKWPEMALHGFGILLEFIKLPDINLCSVAAPRLHTLIETQHMTSSAETSYLLMAINDILSASNQNHQDNYSFVIPVMRALIDKSKVVMDLQQQLPNMPVTAGSPTFFDDFRNYSNTDEWKLFILEKVKPQAEHYMLDNLTEYRAGMVNFWSECHETMMVNGHKRNREKGESKLRFQKQIMEPYVNNVKQEEKRYHDMVARQRTQHLSVLRQWWNVRQFFRSERGAWADKNAEELHWKLSNQENFSRMRPKLTQNYNFDQHTDASYQRDHGGLEAAKSELPQMKIEAKVLRKEVDDDRLGEEEWSLINEAGQITEEHTGKEKLVMAEECELVTVAVVIKGRLEVTTTHIYFFDCSSNREEGAGEDFKCALPQLREIHFRRYNLRRSALEVFLIDQTSYFLNFQKKNRNKVYSQILRLRPSNLIYYGSRSPAELLKASGLTQKWVQREISNFDYLMQLNTIAGRTYNDLSQYPVFPWILSDYTSDVLDLDDPSVYRDLSKPMGVVNPKNEEEVREKYDNFEDPTGTIEKFHYGTHYSNAAGVMHYMVRMEPFTALHIKLQSGKFDVTDRQFHSIPASWHGLYYNPNDVKELIPEFFYLPEFLENLNDFDLGCLHLSQTRISDVVLPKWANSPEDFVYKHRKALESDHVSAHLHEWIDLIFGYKQKGQPAADALNVFFYCTYEGAVDLDAISNPVERKALEGMINNFGQTPSQLLKEPHPRRMTATEAVQKAEKLDKPLSVFQFLNQLKAYFVEVSTEDDAPAYITIPRNQSRSFIQHGMPDAMITVSENGILGIHKWLPYDKSISNYFTFERDPLLASSKVKRLIAGPFAPGVAINPKLFVSSHDAKLLFSGGHWDNSLRVYSMVKGKTVAHIVRHTDIITCLALDYCGSHLITGSRDTTCMIWHVSQQNGVSQMIHEKPSQILYGHDLEISAVAISIELDTTISASADGTVIIHTVRKGLYMRSLRPQCDPWPLTIPYLVISDTGQIAMHVRQRRNTEDSHFIFLYSINGKCLSCDKLAHAITHMLISDDHLLLGNNQGTLIIKELFGLKTLTTMPLYVPIQCLAVANGNSHILVALKDGKLIIVGIKKTAEIKWKLYKAVMGNSPR